MEMSSETESEDIADFDSSEEELEEDIHEPITTVEQQCITNNGAMDDCIEYDRIRQEQAEELAKLKSHQLTALARAHEAGDKRLSYLIAQSEIFAHFLCEDGQIDKYLSNAKQSGKCKSRTRIGEVVEDRLLVNMSDVKSVRLSKQPSNISGGLLRSYQLDGLNWLVGLYDHGVNGILADEMGLGKTIQTISLLAYLKQYRRVTGPHLIIVPKSTVSNWMRELAKWCPSLSVLRLAGTRDERKVASNMLKTNTAAFHVIVANYEAAMKEKSVLSRINWNHLIIDEAHRIKNRESSLSHLVRLLPACHRLLITGTPLQNNLDELWSLLNFLLPDVFGSLDSFHAMFDLSGSEVAKDNVMRKLHVVLKPFMLRRVKCDVERDLPPKTETKIHVSMSSLQKEWYGRVLTRESISLNSLGGPDKCRLLNTMVQLRKVCNHPYLFAGAECGPPFIDGAHLYESSGKMSVLHKLLAKLKEGNHRVLIYSQMVRMLDILEDYLIFIGYKYCRIDGSNDGEERENQIDLFNANDSDKFIFLLSTRAGGLGLNLATADTVILFDSDWNPQVDLQAMDRAHRIGQTKAVRVFRLISEGTVEEKIIERAERKLYLDAVVIQQGRFVSRQQAGLSRAELMTMIKFGAQELLSSREGCISNEDIDVLLRRSQERTAEDNERIKQNMDYCLSNFSVTADCSIKIDELLKEAELNLFDLDGTSSVEQQGGDLPDPTVALFVQLPQRERKHNYDVDEYYKEKIQLSDDDNDNDDDDALNKKKKKKKKSNFVQVHDFQFITKQDFERICHEEARLSDIRTGLISTAKDLFARDARERRNLDMEEMIRVPDYVIKPSKMIDEDEQEESKTMFTDELRRLFAEIDACVLPAAIAKQKAEMIRNGFLNWTKRDFKAFAAAFEKHGKGKEEDVCNDVVNETSLTGDDVSRYYRTFCKRWLEFPDGCKLMEKVERNEMKLQKIEFIKAQVDLKMNRDLTSSVSWQEIKIDYGANKGKLFSEEEDCFLLFCVFKFGYGNFERYKLEIRSTWQFQFDWFFKSRPAIDIQRRVDVLVKLVEKENLSLSLESNPSSKRNEQTIETKRKRKGVKSTAIEEDGANEEDSDEAESKKRPRMNDSDEIA